MDEFPTIWDSSGFVDIPPEILMTVPLKDDWQGKLTNIKPKVYSLGVEARALVDETFDKLQQQGRLLYTQGDTPFNFAVFVLWKPRCNGTKKRQVVVDIKGLNK